MKGKIWLYYLSFILSFGLCFLCSSPVSALNWMEKHWRVWYPNQTSNVYTDVNTSGDFNTPMEILGAYGGTEAGRYLYGFNFWQQMSGTISGAGTLITAEFDVRLGRYQMHGEVPAKIEVFDSTASSAAATAQCAIIDTIIDDGFLYQMKYRCQVTDTHYGATLSSIRITVGAMRDTASYFYYSDISTVDATSTKQSIYLQGFAYQKSTQTSSTDALIETTINQNQTIINQNNVTNNLLGDINDNLQDIADRTDALNDSTQDINDTLTDDTVDTSDIDYSAITSSVPAFGPIATIVNNLIDFPRVFLTDTLCQPLNTPIPEYVGASDSTYLVIPCPSDFLEPYWTAVELIEALAAAYIYFKLAGFIVRQVEYIRDPERDDEEFLNL